MTWKTIVGVAGVYFTLQIPVAMLVGDHLKRRRRVLMTVTRDDKERVLQEVAEDLRKIQRELYGPGEPAPRSRAQPKEQETVKRLPWAPPLVLD